MEDVLSTTGLKYQIENKLYPREVSRNLHRKVGVQVLQQGNHFISLTLSPPPLSLSLPGKLYTYNLLNISEELFACILLFVFLLQ